MGYKKIEYPRAAVGAVVFKDDCVLLVRRKNPPAKDMWAIPGGKIKLGERLQAAAEREVFEETGLVIKAAEPVFSFDMIEYDTKGEIQFHYVMIDLMAVYVSGELRANDDAIEARWINRGEMDSLDINDKSRLLLKERFEFY
jgi:ADP-ribose pyrophosphatase